MLRPRRFDHEYDPCSSSCCWSASWRRSGGGLPRRLAVRCYSAALLWLAFYAAGRVDAQ
jgi:hypothetical protein